MRALILALSLAACGGPAPVTFADTEIALPADPVTLPPGPGMEAVRDNCTACHSPSTMLQQPRLSREKWEHQVEKMVTVYKAPVDSNAIPAIVDYLVEVQERQR